MQKGPAFTDSRVGRSLDYVISRSTRPVETALAIAAARSYGVKYNEAFIHQIRQVSADKQIVIKKTKTYKDDTEIPINELARLYRKFGLDELPQMQSVRDGRMSIWGSRYLLPDHLANIYDTSQKDDGYAALVEHHKKLVLPNKRGYLSTYGIYDHTGSDLSDADRLSMDIIDYENWSLDYNLSMLVWGVSTLVTHEINNRL